MGAVAQKRLLKEDFFLCHILILGYPEAGLEMVTTDYLIFTSDIKCIFKLSRKKILYSIR